MTDLTDPPDLTDDPPLNPAVRPFTLVVTGGIATGKTTVCEQIQAAFPQEAVSFFDADASVHGWLTTPNVVEQIANSLGRDVLAPDGTLDRVCVSKKVFQDAALRKCLESILHPLVRGQCFEMQTLAMAPASPVRLFLADVPLYYESGFPLSADAQLVVACAPQTQRIRLLARSPDRSPHQIDQRLAAQLPILEKVTKATQVLWNGGSRDSLHHQISLFLSWLHVKMPV